MSEVQYLLVSQGAVLTGAAVLQAHQIPTLPPLHRGRIA